MPKMFCANDDDKNTYKASTHTYINSHTHTYTLTASKLFKSTINSRKYFVE